MTDNWTWNPITNQWVVHSATPLISCIMPTCGRCPERQYLIEEAVESFARQDYPNRELVILNDCAGQEFVCDVPGVRIINTADRAGSLGEKYNRLLELANGEYICPWEDDDLSLPWRISLSMVCLGDNDYFNPKTYFFLNGSHFGFEQNTGYAHNASLYRKRTLLQAGGYPHDCKQDAGGDTRLRMAGKTVQGPLARDLAFYIYRWGVGPHLSGNPDPEHAWREYGKRTFPQGRFVLKPHWNADYRAITKTATNSS